METIRVYKYKLDFYYKSIIIYLLFLVSYSLIRGKFSEGNFSVVFNDPIIYIALAFVFFSIILFLLNLIISRQIIFEADKLIFKNRFRQREILFNDILFVKFSRERGKKIEGSRKIRIIKLKLKNRKRYIRIRVTDFYDERKMIGDFKKLSINKQ